MGGDRQCIMVCLKHIASSLKILRFHRAVARRIIPSSFGCGSYVPERNKQQMECENCIHLMERKRIDRDMKVVKKNIKQYQFNSGVTLSLIDETENSLIKTLYVTTVFENSPLYSKACGLNVGDVQQFGGWLNISDNQLTIFFEVVDIDDM